MTSYVTDADFAYILALTRSDVKAFIMAHIDSRFRKEMHDDDGPGSVLKDFTFEIAQIFGVLPTEYSNHPIKPGTISKHMNLLAAEGYLFKTFSPEDSIPYKKRKFRLNDETSLIVQKHIITLLNALSKQKLSFRDIYGESVGYHAHMVIPEILMQLHNDSLTYTGLEGVLSNLPYCPDKTTLNRYLENLAELGMIEYKSFGQNEQIYSYKSVDARPKYPKSGKNYDRAVELLGAKADEFGLDYLIRGLKVSREQAIVIIQDLRSVNAISSESVRDYVKINLTDKGKGISQAFHFIHLNRKKLVSAHLNRDTLSNVLIAYDISLRGN